MDATRKTTEPATLLADFLVATATRSPTTILATRQDAREEKPTTYAVFAERVEALALGLLDAGFAPGERVALFADNCVDWLACDQALALACLVSVPRGTDTAPGELARIIGHSESVAAIVATRKLAAAIAPLCDAIRVLTFEGPVEDAQSLAALEARGRAALAAGVRAPLDEARAATKPSDPCTIVYTSGTTGRPKGVVLTHANLVSNVEGVTKALAFRAGDRFLSILPSWHMFERILEYVVISQACTLVYTDQRRLRNDLVEICPDGVAFVPRIWETIAARMRERIAKLGIAKRALLAPVLALGRVVATGGGGPLLRALHARASHILLGQLWATLGGKLRIAVSGGGSLPHEIDLFLVSLGIPVLNGYGLTETSPVACVRRVASNRIGTVGLPLERTELRVTDPGGRALDRGEVGEVWIRGPQVMQGYHRDVELTEAALDAEGWFRSGDLGRLSADGHLSITGRCKDTIVLAGGENVEPDPIEGQIRTSPYVAQVILVGQDRKVVGALVVPEPAAIAEQVEDLPRPELERRTRELVRAELDRLSGPTSGFRPVDRVGPFALLCEPFSPENGCLTPTLKLRRPAIHELYADRIEALFNDPGS